MFVDSHCHLNLVDLSPYDGNLSKLLEEAREQKVTHFLCVSVDVQEHAQLSQIAATYTDVTISVGLHPNHEPEYTLDPQLLHRQAQDPKVVAIGETGLDYFRSQGDLQWQKQRFIDHIDVAKTCHKPLIIHSRAAKNDTLDILRANNADEVGGVLHCFTEDWEMAKQAMDLNFLISFSGIVSFKNATTLHEVAKKIPIDKMLIETDCPYLAPVPHRGKSNVPAYVPFVAKAIGELRDEPIEHIGEQTSQNFFRVFGE